MYRNLIDTHLTNYQTDLTTYLFAVNHEFKLPIGYISIYIGILLIKYVWQMVNQIPPTTLPGGLTMSGYG